MSGLGRAAVSSGNRTLLLFSVALSLFQSFKNVPRRETAREACSKTHAVGPKLNVIAQRRFPTADACILLRRCAQPAEPHNGGVASPSSAPIAYGRRRTKNCRRRRTLTDRERQKQQQTKADVRRSKTKKKRNNGPARNNLSVITQRSLTKASLHKSSGRRIHRADLIRRKGREARFVLQDQLKPSITDKTKAPRQKKKTKPKLCQWSSR